MNANKVSFRIILATLISASFTGCGGGSDSNDDSDGNLQTQAESYDSCNSLLVGGILENADSSDTEAKLALNRSTLRQWLCSDTSSPDIDDELTVRVINYLSPTAQGLSTIERRAEICETHANSFAGSELSHSLLSRSNTISTTSWTQCIKDNRPDKLACYAIEQSDSIKFSIDLDQSRGNISNATIASSNLVSDADAPSDIEPGVTEKLFHRSNPEIATAAFSLQGDADALTVKCDYKLSTMPLSEQQWESCETFRYQALLDGQIQHTDYVYMLDHNEVPLFDSQTGELIGRYNCALYSETEEVSLSALESAERKPNDKQNKKCEAFRLQSLENGQISQFDYYYLKDANHVPLFSSQDGSYIGHYPCSEFE